ncbi:MAG: protein-export chaperone SecB [Betaproteobacteria bacterium]|jgi:preprotein translocase subunit SecB|nr:protein-export chaperone SecB [Betaproteobacteria bacterium]NBS92769.1 protein-export chaperone SecB [Betaproteobacteria bacterium]NBT05495.1 protein-export chaperone SecB [Betaproteobacteria bacterium]NBU11929.1 protein-export chaperone SecB [Betaproteobacteria bacterium]NBY52540.1 protein-export chaperone SecB [Betaproteobacteria bacterium]
MAQEQANQEIPGQAANPQFAIEKLYIKDLSLEVPNAPQIFLDREPPQIGIELQTTVNSLGDDMYDVTIKVTVTAKAGEKTVFLVEVAQAGVFGIVGVPEEQLQPILMIACPNILFPYAREAVSSTVTRAGFLPVLLNPVNFEALFAQQQQAQQQVQ